MVIKNQSAALRLKNKAKSMTKINEQTTNHDQATEQSLSQSIFKNALGLAVFAFITAGVIVITQQLTTEKITLNIAQAKAKALYEITPKKSVDNDLLNDTLLLNQNNLQSLSTTRLLGAIEKDAEIFFAKKDNVTHTLIFPVSAPDGYTTAIKMLVGIKVDGSISGVRVVDHKETPGLGDKIEMKKSQWISNFQGKSLINPETDEWKVKKDGGQFDQFTGATITPRAVVNAVKNALLFYRENQSQIFHLKQQNDKKQNVQINKGEDQ